MHEAGRALILLGGALLVLGVILYYGDGLSFLRLGRLPGDIIIKRDGFRFYFPLATCAVVSLVLTLLLYLFRK